MESQTSKEHDAAPVLEESDPRKTRTYPQITPVTQ
jgi:hypothetical protein